jgi:predicted secreted protein
MNKDIQTHYVLAAAGVCIAVAVGLAYLLAPHLLRTKTEEDTVTLGTNANQKPAPTGKSPQAPKQNETPLCAQVITRAKDPASGTVHDFPTPCDVPVGWHIISPK